MERLQQCKKYVDWFEPLHTIASEQTGLSDFGADKSYQTGLRVILESMDDDCDLNEVGLYTAPLRLVQNLTQRLRAEQAFKNNPAMLEQPIEKPLLITGIVRTGSTALHHLMARDPDRQHLEYWLADDPMPRPPKHEWAEHPSFLSTRASLKMMYEASPKLKAIHYLNEELPAECGQLLSQTFTDDFWPGVRSTPYYNRWYEHCDMVPTYTQHKKLLQWIGSNEPDKPWLLKYPVHMRHLKSFLSVYPDARVIWTHRDPATIISSYTSMIEVLRGLSVRPETIDRGQILRELMEIWAPGVERAMAVRELYPEAQFYDLHFSDLVADPVAQVQNAYQQFGLDWTPECDTALRQWNEDNPQHKRGQHGHSADQLALSREEIQERFASYINRFDVQCT